VELFSPPNGSLVLPTSRLGSEADGVDWRRVNRTGFRASDPKGSFFFPIFRGELSANCGTREVALSEEEKDKTQGKTAHIAWCHLPSG